MNPTPAAVYTGVSNAIATISKAEGIRSLWRGVSSVIVGAGQSEPGESPREDWLMTIFQAQHMLYTLRRTRQSSREWEATTGMRIIPSQQVWPIQLVRWTQPTHELATSGACATIASDALMNPFDGGYYTSFLEETT